MIHGLALLTILLSGGPTADGCTGFYDSFGSGCPGSGGIAPTLKGLGCPVPGELTTLAVHDHAPGRPAFLLIGAGHTSLPFTPWCTLQVTDLYSPPLIPLPLSATGDTRILGRVPQLPAPEVFLQLIILDAEAPGGFAATNPIEMNIGI